MNDSSEREAILYAFAIEPKHDQETLQRYLQQYPDLAEELIDLSSEIRLSDVLGESPASSVSQGSWESGWQEFLASRMAAASPDKLENPFARFRGEAFVILAETLNVSRSFLTAFRDGLVAASSIPEGFVRRFANATQSSVAAVRAYFAHPQLAIGTREFKSDNKPTFQGQMTFEELVHSSDMTDEQRQVLLQDMDDGLNRGQSTES
jgi:hypothetical protein